jgi:hypothetical protein
LNDGNDWEPFIRLVHAATMHAIGDRAEADAALPLRVSGYWNKLLESSGFSSAGASSKRCRNMLEL